MWATLTSRRCCLLLMTALACGPMLPENALLVTMSCIKQAPNDHGSIYQLLLDWVKCEPHGDKYNLLTSLPTAFNEVCFTEATAMLTSLLVDTIQAERFALFSDHNGSLIRQQPGADTQQTWTLCFTNCCLAAQVNQFGRIGAEWCARNAYVIRCRVGVLEELMASWGDPCQLHGQTPIKGGPVFLGGNQ